jgi:hypothetical protein
MACRPQRQRGIATHTAVRACCYCCAVPCCAVKVKVKAFFWGLFVTEAMQAYCTLAPENFLPSPLEALCIGRHTTHSAGEGRNCEIWLGISQFPKRAGFFFMPQSWDMGQILLPLRRKACCGFFQSEKCDGFGRERTRDLGFQRPACCVVLCCAAIRPHRG